MSLICYKAIGWDGEKLCGGTTNAREAKQVIADYLSHYGYDGKITYVYDSSCDTWVCHHEGTDIRPTIVRYDVDAIDYFMEDHV